MPREPFQAQLTPAPVKEAAKRHQGPARQQQRCRTVGLLQLERIPIQHRRKTFAQKLDWNAAPPGSTLTIEFIGGAANKKLLPAAARLALAS